VLASNSKANQIKAIEKAALYDANYLTTAIAKNTPQVKTNETTVLANNPVSNNKTITETKIITPETTENTIATVPETSNNAITETTKKQELVEENLVDEEKETPETKNNTINSTETVTPELTNNIIQEDKVITK